MEAANLGASLASYDEADVDAALAELAAVPSFRPSIGAWAAAGLSVRARFPGNGGVSIPTWFYGHEPPNVFAGSIAKYFSNAQREDVLLNRARGGIIYLPGAAGTVQEVFQAVTPNYYGDAATQIPLVLVGVDHWTDEAPRLAPPPIPSHQPPHGPVHPPGRHHRRGRRTRRLGAALRPDLQLDSTYMPTALAIGPLPGVRGPAADVYVLSSCRQILGDAAGFVRRPGVA